jgi:hypothetical protein
MRRFAAALFLTLSTIPVTAGAQQLGHDWSIVNNSSIALTRLEMATRTGQRVGGEWKATETIRLAENLSGNGETLKVAIKPKTKECEWNVTYYAVQKGGGSSMVDLCGKSRIIIATRPGRDLPEVSAE